MHKQLFVSVKTLVLSLLAVSRPPQETAERSGKRGYCAAFNEALPVQRRLETLHKVCALAFAFSAAHIVYSAQR